MNVSLYSEYLLTKYSPIASLLDSVMAVPVHNTLAAYSAASGCVDHNHSVV